MTTSIVDTDTTQQLKVNRNYTYQVYYGNNTATYVTHCIESYFGIRI
jgi:hypothetical protein